MSDGKNQGRGPQGTLTFGGASFNALQFSDIGNGFGIDNLNVSSAPEPSQVAGLGFTALGLGALLLRARKRKAQAVSVGVVGTE